MNPIRLSSIIQTKRREKGITQEELAAYAGVSKAAVSKWENGQSYPDVSLLPILAAYFNVSIDELIGYEPQMTKEDIKKLYIRLSKDFAEKPFKEVYQECCNIISKYYSCFPLVLQMGILLLNHGMLSKDQAQTKEIMEKAKEMFVRVREESEDIAMAHQALHTQAYCELQTGNFQEVIHLLGDVNYNVVSTEPLLAAAWASSGNVQQAVSVLQQGAYLNLMYLHSMLTEMLLYDGEEIQFEETVTKMKVLEEEFQLPELHPGPMLTSYAVTAQAYLKRDNKEKALEYLRKYGDVACRISFPMRLKGDRYFDHLDSWFDDFELGDNAPRDSQLIQKSFLEVLTANPMFAVLHEDIEYKNIVKKIQEHYKLA